MLLAVDLDQRIVGADRNARTTLLCNNHGLEKSVSLWGYLNGIMGSSVTKIAVICPHAWRPLVQPSFGQHLLPRRKVPSGYGAIRKVQVCTRGRVWT
jgi:hypothetical protein